jgi:formylglycine-generating enzyme required for sulfatase activity
MSRVFISHSTEDRDFVERVLVPALHGYGLETWYSKDDIPAADRWERSILDGLKSSDWFLIVMSANSAKSNWVLHELHWAMDHRPIGRIVPVMIEECDPYDFHIGLPRLQFVDYGRDRERALAQLKAIWVKADAPPIRDPIWAKAEPVPDLIITKTADIPLQLIPAGTFLMGSLEGEGEDHERPRHKVTISRPFYLGIHPVTQRQYARLLGENPSWFAATGKGKDKVAGMDTSRFPVECVNWYDAVRFCNALSQAEGLKPCYTIRGGRVEMAGSDGFRLPTEAEWEYACRAGTSSPYGFPGGEEELPRYAWFAWNSGKRTHAVGEAGANDFGLHDMHGNVWEWTWDDFEFDYYMRSPEIDPVGSSTEAAARVVRGGCWDLFPRGCRSANRYRNAPGYRHSHLGFRALRVRSSR